MTLYACNLENGVYNRIRLTQGTVYNLTEQNKVTAILEFEDREQFWVLLAYESSQPQLQRQSKPSHNHDHDCQQDGKDEYDLDHNIDHDQIDNSKL